MEKSSEERNREEKPRPGGRDIIKVDGRWGQTFFCGGIIRWLDTGKEEQIDLNEYEFVKTWNWHVESLMERGEQFTDEEISRIEWSGEGPYPAHLKKHVNVFGEYERKK